MTDIREVEPGIFSILLNGRVLEARVDGNTVTVEGRSYRLERADPRKWNPNRAGPQAHGRAAVKSPMPGKIIQVLVSAGDEVAAGQGVVVVEAMKMQNELKTTSAGRVKSIHVKQNDTVEAGAVLVVVE